MVKAITVDQGLDIKGAKFPHESYQYFPTFEGSTGGWLRSAELEEKYVITWTSPCDKYFEMPIGGSAQLHVGLNLFYFSRKEQCLALGKQLRSEFKINDYKIFRLIPGGEIQFLHPKDSVFPEKVNSGRVPVGKRDFSIGLNPNPSTVRFSGINTYDTESSDSVKYLSANYATFLYRWSRLFTEMFRYEKEDLVEQLLDIDQEISFRLGVSLPQNLDWDSLIYSKISDLVFDKKVELSIYSYTTIEMVRNETVPYNVCYKLSYLSYYFDIDSIFTFFLKEEEKMILKRSDGCEMFPSDDDFFIPILNMAKKCLVELNSREEKPFSYLPRRFLVRKDFYPYYTQDVRTRKIPISKLWNLSQYIFCFSTRLSNDYSTDFFKHFSFVQICHELFRLRVLFIYIYAQNHKEFFGEDKSFL